MKRWLCLLMAALLLMALPLSAPAEEEGSWFIPDSATRQLSEKELWQWDYESLGYILHEIYARHGYHFDPGSDYERYFTAQSWYAPSGLNNIDGCFTEMTDLEWANADLIEQVRLQMFLRGSMNPEGRSVWSDEPVISPLDFQLADMARGEKYAVYSAPSTKAWRGAKSKASVSTNGDVWAAGWADGWLLIYYETSKGSIRVGYIDGDKISGSVAVDKELVFAGTPARITAKCSLTDDTARAASTITTLKAGAEVTYLAPYYSDSDWAYIETKYDKKTVRAFVPMDCIELIEGE